MNSRNFLQLCLSCSSMCAEKCETDSPTGGKSRSQSIHRPKHELEFYSLPRSNVVPRSIPNTSCRELDMTSIKRITYECTCEYVQMHGLTRNRRTSCTPGTITTWSIHFRHHVPFGTSTSVPRGSRASACVPRGGVIFGSSDLCGCFIIGTSNTNGSSEFPSLSWSVHSWIRFFLHP